MRDRTFMFFVAVMCVFFIGVITSSTLQTKVVSTGYVVGELGFVVLCNGQTDAIPPQFSSLTNTTPAIGQNFSTNITWSDVPNGCTVDSVFFESNYSGVYTNYTVHQGRVGSLDSSFSILSGNNTEGRTTTWRWHALDTATNRNTTSFFSYTFANETPRFSNLANTSSTPTAGDNWIGYANVTDNGYLDTVIFESNYNGNYTNYTVFQGSSLYSEFVSFTILGGNLSAGEVVSYRWIANDSIGLVNATQYSNFTVKAAPTGGGSPGGGGGGGGGGIGGAPPVRFDFSPDFLTLELFQGEQKDTGFTIYNTEQTPHSFSISAPNASLVIVPDPSDVTIGASESRDIVLHVFALRNKAPGIYTEKIQIRSGSTFKTLTLVVNVKPLESLFDVKVDILPEYKIVSPGQSLVALVTLENIKQTAGEAVDVDIELDVQGLNNDTIASTTKSVVAVSTKFSTAVTVNIPSNINTGRHLLIARATYTGQTTSAFDTFDVVEGGGILGAIAIFIIIVLVLGGLLALDFYKHHEFTLIPVSKKRKKKAEPRSQKILENVASEKSRPPKKRRKKSKSRTEPTEI